MTGTHPAGPKPYNVVIVTLDAHAAGPAARIAPALSSAFPGITVTIYAAAEWAENPSSLAATKAAVAKADMIIANMLFIEEHVNAILPDLTAARDRVDAMICLIADTQVTKLTKMGAQDMSKPASPLMALLKKLKPKKGTSASSGERQMSMLRRIPKILRFIPGKSQDLRAWFLSMQYWLGGSDDNMEQMLRYLMGRYASRTEWRGIVANAPIDCAEVAMYHPDLPNRIITNLADLPRPVDAKVTAGLLMLRSYVLASDTAHYDAVIRGFEARGIACVPAFAGGLDGRLAITAFFQNANGVTVDAMVSLTGFSLVGGPAYNDSDAAVAALDVPYIAAHPLEFQTRG